MSVSQTDTFAVTDNISTETSATSEYTDPNRSYPHVKSLRYPTGMASLPVEDNQAAQDYVKRQSVNLQIFTDLQDLQHFARLKSQNVKQISSSSTCRVFHFVLQIVAASLLLSLLVQWT